MEGVDDLPERLWPTAIRLGLALVSMPGPPHLLARLADPATTRQGYAEVHVALALAVGAGVHHLRVGYGRPPLAGPAACAQAAEILAPVAAAAVAIGIPLLVEARSGATDRGVAAVDLVGLVDSPGVRIAWAQSGTGPDDCGSHLAIATDLLGYVRVVDPDPALLCTGRPATDLAPFIRSLTGRGYTGWFGHACWPRDDPIATLSAAVAAATIRRPRR